MAVLAARAALAARRRLDATFPLNGIRSRFRRDAPNRPARFQHRHPHRHAVGDLRRISDCGPSATSSSISTPRFIGPGCSTTASAAARCRRVSAEPVVDVVVVERRDQAFFHAFALQAQHHHRIDAIERGVEILRDRAAGQRAVVFGQQAISVRRRGSRRRPARAARAGRSARRANGGTSPTISTFSFEKSAPLAWRRVSMSSRPWVGCALRPSPALSSAVSGIGGLRQRRDRAVSRHAAPRSRARPSPRWS